MNCKIATFVAGSCLPFLFAGNVNAVPLGEGFELDIEVGAVSDYRDKGISQSLGDPAIQGGVTLTSPIGLYTGVWVSSVDYGAGVDTRREQDYYVGWYVPITDDLSLDLGVLRYEYPKSSELNQTSSYAIFRYLGFELSYQYSDNVRGDQSGSYTSIAYMYPVNDSTRLMARYGVVDAKDNVIVTNSGNSRSRYNEGEVGIEKDLWGVTWKASYVDTDLSKSECLNTQGYDDICSGSVVIGVTKSF